MERCKVCNGNTWTDMDTPDICPHCNGTGYEPMDKLIAIAVDITKLRDIRSVISDTYNYLNASPVGYDDMFNRRSVLIDLNKILVLLDSIINTANPGNRR